MNKLQEIDQKRSQLIKELNYLFRNPRLTDEDREKAVQMLEQIVLNLKQ